MTSSGAIDSSFSDDGFQFLEFDLDTDGRAGQAVGKPVGVCGEAAADPLLACVLVGLGVTSLSAASAAVTAVGAKLASVTGAQCREAAEAVLTTASSAEARAAALAVLG